MLGLILDAGALILIVMVVNQDDEVGLFKAMFVALAISLVCGLAAVGLAELGEVALFVGLVPLAFLAGLVVWLTLGMAFKRSMVAGAVFLVYKIVISIVFTMLFS